MRRCAAAPLVRPKREEASVSRMTNDYGQWRYIPSLGIHSGFVEKQLSKEGGANLPGSHGNCKSLHDAKKDAERERLSKKSYRCGII